MTQLSRQVYIAQKARIKAEAEQQEFELRQAQENQRLAIENSMAQARAQLSSQQQQNQQALVDARVAQVNSLTNAINMRNQATQLEFNTQQDRLSTRVGFESAESDLARRQTNQQQQLQNQTSQVGQQIATRQAQEVGRGGTSSQTAASARGQLSQVARSQAELANEQSVARNRLGVEEGYAGRLLDIQDRLARNQARGIRVQADVQQQLSDTVAEENISTANSNLRASANEFLNTAAQLRREASQSSANFADALRQVSRDERAQIRSARSLL